jgi:hypothetical protein
MSGAWPTKTAASVGQIGCGSDWQLGVRKRNRWQGEECGCVQDEERREGAGAVGDMVGVRRLTY